MSGDMMLGCRICRAVCAALVLLPLTLLSGCMGLRGQKNNNQPHNTTTTPSVPIPPANPAPPNPTASITVTPGTVVAGGKVTVSWQTQNASTISLDENGKTVPLDGNPLSSPGMPFTLSTVGTTTFTLTANGPSGTTAATAQASVNVTAAPPPSGPTATLTANPTTVTVGQAVALTWTTTNATSVTLSQNGTNVPIGAAQTSTSVTLNSLGTVAFVLTATGAQGATTTAQASVQVTQASNPGDISAINHIIFVAEENRSFDVYFGKLNEYRAKLGLGPDVDGLPDNCSSSNSDWTKQCGAMNKAPDASGAPKTPIYAFHLKTMCIENTSADWIVSRWAFNAEDPSSNTPLMDGFVIGAASATAGSPGTNPTIPDKQGIRAMGFYTAQDLEYHYWLATQFAVADKWFSRSEEHTSELQSQSNLVCRLLLEK